MKYWIKAGWKMKDNGIREKDGVKAEFRLLYPASDDTRQSCAEAFAVQCKKIGINVILKVQIGQKWKKHNLSDACNWWRTIYTRSCCKILF